MERKKMQTSRQPVWEVSVVSRGRPSLRAVMHIGQYQLASISSRLDETNLFMRFKCDNLVVRDARDGKSIGRAEITHTYTHMYIKYVYVCMCVSFCAKRFANRTTYLRVRNIACVAPQLVGNANPSKPPPQCPDEPRAARRCTPSLYSLRHQSYAKGALKPFHPCA